MSRHLVHKNHTGGGAKTCSELLSIGTQGSHPKANDAAREQAGVGAGPRKRHLGTDTLYLATKSTIAGSASAGKWEECRGMVLEGQVWRGAGNGPPERGRSGRILPR